MPVSRPVLILVAAAASILSLVPLDRAGAEAPVPPSAAPKLSDLHRGMPAAEVLQRLGKPKHVARQVLYGRYVEQWTYEGPLAVRLTFDWRKGQEKQILTVQPLTTPAH